MINEYISHNFLYKKVDSLLKLKKRKKKEKKRKKREEKKREIIFRKWKYIQKCICTIILNGLTLHIEWHYWCFKHLLINVIPVIYRNPFWFTKTFQNNSQAKTINNKQIKLQTYISKVGYCVDDERNQNE